MNKSWFYLGILGSMVTILAGCSGEGEKKAASPTASAKPDRAASPAPKTNPSTAANPAPSASPVATKPTPAPSNFNQPLVAAKPSDTLGKTSTTGKAPAIDVAAGLIPPTNADDWTKTVSKGRSDPFATLSIQPIEVFPEGEKATRTPVSRVKSVATKTPSKSQTIAKTTQPKHNSIAEHSPSETPANPDRTKSKSSSSKVAKSATNKPSAKARLGKAIPGKIAIANRHTQPPSQPGKSTKIAKSQTPKVAKAIAAKPLRETSVSPKSTPKTALRAIPTPIAPIQPLAVKAEPTQARALGISGVIEIDGITQVILKLPNETFSRYVEVGDRIANGKVLVKRVEKAQSLSPIIVLEEGGIEISRPIGEGIEPKPTTPGKTAAAKPAPQEETAQPSTEP